MPMASFDADLEVTSFGQKYLKQILETLFRAIRDRIWIMPIPVGKAVVIGADKIRHPPPLLTSEMYAYSFQNGSAYITVPNPNENPKGNYPQGVPP